MPVAVSWRRSTRSTVTGPWTPPWTSPRRPNCRAARSRRRGLRGPRQALPRGPRSANGRHGGRRPAPTASTGPHPAPGSSPSTRRRPRCRARCTSATCSPTRTPMPWPASGACGATTSSIPWDGTTTAFPPSDGCRTTTASAATPACATTPPSHLPRSRARRRSRCRGPTSSSCATGWSVEDEKAFEHLWRTLGLSVDWSQTYATIDTTARRTSQHGFLRMLRDGYAYSAEAPTQWDVDFQTAVSQAEMEDRELPGRLPPGAVRLGRARSPPSRSRRRARTARRLRRPRGQPR